jgi:hypothetical protein
MSRNELQRISELRDYSISLRSPEAYFQHDDDKLSSPITRGAFFDIESNLQRLDAEAWASLKSKALPLLEAKQHLARRWQPLFDTLNEAKGYDYLAKIGCTNIRFIPRSNRNNIQTPDLQGVLASTKVLCEVKTINWSDVEIDRFHSGGVGMSLTYIGDGFFRKLLSDVKTAASQMLTFCPDTEIHRIAFIVAKFDDYPCEYKNVYDYRGQVEAYMASVPMPDVQVVLDF